MTEDMRYNMERLRDRILEAVENTDLDRLFAALRGIQGPTVVCGCGGSSVVAQYVCQVLEKKNGIVCVADECRSVLRTGAGAYENVIAISYSGGNLGVKAASRNEKKKYLLSVNEKPGFLPLLYGVSERETSYISMSATFIPMAMLFLYYTDGNVELLRQVLDGASGTYEPRNVAICEILGGEENRAAVKCLESTITEGGMRAAVVHDKYNFCHGRINLNVKQDSELLYFDGDTELDELFKRVLLPMYEGRVTVIGNSFDDPVVNDYRQTMEAMLLCCRMAEERGIDLSIIEECPQNNFFYLFDGTM